MTNTRATLRSRCDETALPTTGEMMEWIRSVVSRGVRRPGFEADADTEQWLVRELRALGLDDVHLEPIDVVRWEEGGGELELWIDGEASQWSCFPLPFSAPADDIRAEVALDTFDETGDASALEGKIAVYANRHLTPATALFRDHLATRSYDPEGNFDRLVHTQPFGPRIQAVMEPAMQAGARGFIGIVGQSWESEQYYVPYDAISRDFPGVWISPAAGQQLLAAIESGARVEARIRSRSEQRRAVSHNVIALLPGASDEWVIVGTHHDAPWLGAVEDGSGIALVLAQARYWSRIPRSERPFGFLFLFNGGHMSDGAGIRHFVQSQQPRIDQSVLAVHLEHVAREPRVENGVLRPSDQVTPRWWFTSRIAPLEDAVEQVIQHHDLRRSLILPPKALFENPPTDGAFLYPAGVPIVQLLAAPEYLFDIGDTLEMVHEDSLLPITRAVIDLVMTLSGWDGKSLRALDRDRGEEREQEREQPRE